MLFRSSGAGGTIVSMPVGAAVETLANETPRRLGDSFGIAGIEGVRLEAEGLLDATISVVGVAGPTDFANLLSVVPSLTVTFDAPVVNSTLAPPDPATTNSVKSRSTTTTVAPQLVQTDTEILPAGPLSLAPEQVVAALNARRIGDPESARLPRVKTIWESLASAVGERNGRGAAAPAEAPQRIRPDPARPGRTLFRRPAGGQQSRRDGLGRAAGRITRSGGDRYQP